MKHTVYRLLAAVMCLCLLCTGCATPKEPQKEPHTVTVSSEGGLPLQKVGVFVYKDKEQTDLLWAGQTDKEGTVSFKALPGEYTVALRDVPPGYRVKTAYALTEKSTALRLAADLLKEEAMNAIRFQPGDVMCDFSVTVQGVRYKLSELLSKRKAVVLNFWFEGCGPCRAEFPYLQKAYEAYKDQVAVIAINPVDGTAASVAKYAADMGLTFPAVVGEETWVRAFTVSAYPTTVVIDRYGTVALMHKGAVTEEGVFEKLFAYFTAEDYRQTTLRDLSDLG